MKFFRVRLDDGNSDNRANSAQFQLKLPTGAELGKNAPFSPQQQQGKPNDNTEVKQLNYVTWVVICQIQATLVDKTIMYTINYIHRVF